MQRARNIIIFLLCTIVVYTGSGFAEIHYNCAGCMDKSLHLSQLFFPTKVSTSTNTVSGCGCKVRHETKKQKSCCDKSHSKKESGNCRTTKISKLDITNELSTIAHNPTIACVTLVNDCIPEFGLKPIDNNSFQFIEDTSPPPLTGLYPIIYCTFLI